MARDSPTPAKSKLRVRFDHRGPALDAWVEVLSVLFATMQESEAGLRRDDDPEVLHDYRVAVRRTRSVLGQARGILPRDVLEWFRDDFAWIGQVSGPARDLDVHLLALSELEAGLSPARLGALAPFGTFLERRRREARTELLAELDGARYSALVERWRAFLDDPAGGVDPSDTPEAGRPARSVAARRTLRAHRRLIAHGRGLDHASPPERLHEVRKDAKKLRYLIECFGGLFDTHDVAPVVKELKGLQDVLGEIQDCHVQAGSLEHFGEEMSKSLSGPDDGTPTATLLALGAVIERLDQRERAARQAFGERFERFDAKPVRRRVKAAFGTRGSRS